MDGMVRSASPSAAELLRDGGTFGGLGESTAWKRESQSDGPVSLADSPVRRPVKGEGLIPTPTADTLPRRFADFETLADALDYAAKGLRGCNFHDARGTLISVLTYRTLRDQALVVSARLIALGLAPGDRVALLAETTPEFMTLFMGCIYAGTLPVPLPLPTSFGGREGYVQQIGNQMAAAKPAAAFGPDGLLGLLQDACEPLGVAHVLSWSQANDLPAGKTSRRSAKGSDIAYLQYSSGSTRFPHGVAVTHTALLANARGKGLYGTAIIDTDRVISWLPYYHDMGLVGCFLAVLSCQVSIDLIATEDFARRPLTWLTLISRNPGTSVSYSPTFGYDIATRRAPSDVTEKFDLSRWRVAGNGGDMIRPDVMQAFVDAFAPAGFDASAFTPSYGLAEATLAVTFMPLGEGIVTDLVDEAVLSGAVDTPANLEVSAKGKLGPARRYRAIVNCGKVIPDHQIAVRDQDDKTLPDGRIGRVLVKGPSVMAYYFEDEAATRACLSADGWLDTGDLGYLSDGSLFIVGRAKDMFTINGRNHWPQDIEWAVEQMPGLKSGDIAAFSVTVAEGEDVPAVLVQCRITDDAARAEFQNQIRVKVRQITGVNCVVELVPPKSLPRTSSGKLSRSKARSLYLAGLLQPLSTAA
jgi:fatty-acyl-CoA synthase